SNVLVKFEDKQKVLEKFDPMARLELTCVLMQNEAKLLSYELDIHKRVRAKLDQNQREFFLREQMKLIQSELGGGDQGMSDSEEYLQKIAEAKLPQEVSEKLQKEAAKLDRMQFGSAESSLIRNYLDVCLELPWNKTTADRTDVAAAQKVLERDHDGLDKVKQRILEYIAVKQLNPDAKNQILCLVGPPGVGKTSIASSVAKALKRKFVRVSLGGVRDEADIRGHRKTYIGAMPGRIIDAISRSKVKNPLILLDEIDKLTRDSHGDPSSALLEVLDGEQNKNFRDHFIELPFDLSDCIFIATANTLDTVPAPLIDRMEIIKLGSYTRAEKLSIAKHHLIPKQLKRHGLSKKTLSISDGAILAVIDSYTSEAGVRNLEREIGTLCRKSAKSIIDGESKVKITEENIDLFLGAPKVIKETISDEDEIAVVNGLAYTDFGGEMLKIEIAVFDGTGKIELTGSLGDVMKESAKTAVSCVRAMAQKLGIDPDFYKNKDIHIHAPEGAVPKDGPSAGVTMMTALVSALTGKAVKRDVAMTGEITLRGKVLAIGGLKEKSMAAYRAGVKTVIIPDANKKDIPETDETVRRNITFIPVKTAEEVLLYALSDSD
ncbi:MAG: endopeptidase La, partial [Clostridia bacterium]|nr:endopeptidase La [Clostridia bacterium]